MKIGRVLSIILIAGMFIMACNNPITGIFDGTDGADTGGSDDIDTEGDPADNATDDQTTALEKITIGISPVSSRLLNELQQASADNSRSISSRAYMFANTVEWAVYDKNGTPVNDEYGNPVAGIVFGNEPNDYTSVDWDIIEFTIYLPPDIDYSIDIDVYNNAVDPNNPVVSGSSMFDVIRGMANSVWVGLFPISPTPLSLSGETVYPELVGATYDYTNEVFTSYGGEVWYSITTGASPPSAAEVSIFPYDSGSNVYFAVYNSSNSFLVSGLSPDFFTATGGAAFRTFGLSPNETYYVGAILIKSDNSLGTVELSCGESAALDDGYEHNDDITGAYSITYPTTINAQCYDEDYYAFSISQPTLIDIALDSTNTETATYTGSMVLFGATEDDVIAKWQGDLTSSTGSLTAYLETSGTYHVGVSIDKYTNPGFGMGGDYTLSIAESSAAALTVNGGWKTEYLTAGTDLWYYFPAAEGKDYSVWWNDYDGDGTYATDIKVSAYQSDMTTSYFTDSDFDAFSTPEKLTVSTGESLVYLKVYGYDSAEAGDFDIAVSHNTNIVRGEIYLYSEGSFDGTPIYYCWDDDDDPSNGWVGDATFTFGTDDRIGYEAWVDIGTYYVYAFADTDGNSIYDESADYFGYANRDYETDTVFPIDTGEYDPWWDIELIPKWTTFEVY